MKSLIRLYRNVVAIVKAIITLGCVALALTGAVMVSGLYKQKPIIVKEQVQVEVERQEPSLKQLVQDIPPKYGISPLLIAAIVERESGAKRDAIRYEPGQMSRAAAQTSDPQKQRMLATSFGYMQVMGWWSKEFGISWADLLDGETNVEVGCAILKKCLDRHKEKGKIKQLHGALWCFNGSSAYADAIISRLGGILIEREFGDL